MKTNRPAAAALCLAVFLLGGLSGCGKKIASAEDVALYSAEELTEFSESVTEEQLIQSWGEPETVNGGNLWAAESDGRTRYIYERNTNGKINVFVSYSLYVTVSDIRENTVYGLVSMDDYTTDYANLTVLPDFDVFGNEIAYNIGEQYCFEFDGIIMETYPAQINRPYSAVLTGQLTDEEAETLTAPAFLFDEGELE